MGIKSKILFHQSSGMYERDLSSKIKSLVIPKRIFLKSSNDLMIRIFIMREIDGFFIFLEVGDMLSLILMKCQMQY